MNRLRAIALAVCTVVLALVMTLPAQLLQRFLPPSLTVAAIDGTVWQGRLESPHWQGQELVDELSWDWHPLALLWLDLQLEITTRRHDQAGHALLNFGLFSTLFHHWRQGPPPFSVRDLNLDLPLAPLAAEIPLLVEYQLRGDLSLHSPAFSWAGDKIGGELQLDWRNATSQLSGATPMGSYHASFQAKERGYLLSLVTESGALKLQGDGSGNPDDGWSGGVTITAPNGQFANFAALLAHFGPPGPDGSYRLRYSFRGDPHLPKNF